MSKKEYTQPQAIGINPSKYIMNVTKTKMNSPEKSFFLTKIGLLVLIYIFLVLNSLYDYASPTHVPECVTDKMHDVTLPITEFLGENPIYRNILIIFASLMIDITVFSVSVKELFYGKNYKLFGIFFVFYAFRAFLQSVFFLKFPTNYIWGHPGLFSITVPYAPANDFFYSGHMGLCTICYIYFKRGGYKKFQMFGLVTMVAEFFTLLVTRAHYFVDLVIGMIVAHYIYLAFDWLYDYMAERKKNKEDLKIKEQKVEEQTVKEQSLERGRPEEANPVRSGKNKGKKLVRTM